MRNRALANVLAVSTAIGACLGCAGFAHAQEAPEIPPANSAATKEVEDDDTDRVVVTARFREESVIDVPATATFLSADDVESRVVASSRDLARTIPGLTVSNTGSEANMNVVVRGQGASTAFRGNAEGAVGLYEDGAFVGSSSLNRFAYVDLQRAEVLRGPQSAYFGRDALGGAVNLIHNGPELGGTSGRLSVGYGINDTRTAEGYVNVPVGDTFALRIAGTYLDKQEGFFENSPDPRTGGFTEQFADREDYSGVRAQALWQPDDNFSLALKLERFEEDAPGLGLYSYDLILSGDDPYSPNIDTTDRLVRTTDAQSLVLTWNVGGGVLTSRTVGRQSDSILHYDRDALFGIPFNGGGATAAARERWEGYRDALYQSIQQSVSFTHPVSLFGLDGDLATGVDYLDSKSKAFSYEATICASSSPPPSGLGCLTGAAADPANANALSFGVQDFESISAFASLRLDMTDRLSVTFDGRVLRDETSSEGLLERGSNSVRVYDHFVNPVARADSAAWENFSPAISAVYELTDDTNLFGRVATGYRPGGFNQRTGADLSIPPGTDLIPGTFDPETNISYELGLKGEYRDVFLVDEVFMDVAGYYIASKDVVIDNTTSVINPTDTIINNTNAGETLQYGVEAQMRTRTRVGETIFTTSVSANYAEGFYDTIGALANPQINAATGTISSPGTSIYGNAIPLLPKWQASWAIGLTHPLTDDIELFGTLGGTGEWDQAHDQSQAVPVSRKIPDRVLWDLDLGVRFDSVTVRAQVKNLFDNQFWTAPSVTAQGRTVRTNLPTEWRLIAAWEF